MNLKKPLKSLIRFLPEILVLFASIFLVIHSPEPLADQTKGSLQFEALSRSILHGEYGLQPGVPSMYREPGYPALRALFYAFGANVVSILYIQVILTVLTVFVWRKTWALLDPKLEQVGAWGTALAYGYWALVQFHGYEIMLGLVLALAMYLSLRFYLERRNSQLFSAAISIGVLTATRGVFMFLFIPLAIIFALRIRSEDLKKILWKIAVFCLLANAIPVGWMARNYVHFDSFSIASRPGIVMYVRAIKAEAPWGAWVSSLASSIVTERIAILLLPNLPKPITFSQNTPGWLRYEELVPKLGDDGADKQLLVEAKEMIFKNPTNFSRYVAWSVVDEIRLFGLASPKALAISIESLMEDDAVMTTPKIGVLATVAMVELAWWIFCILGLIFAGKKNPKLLLIAIPIFYLMLIHAPLDNNARFSAPVQPIVGAMAVYGLWYLINKNKKAPVLDA